jgi:hypothetical protein
MMGAKGQADESSGPAEPSHPHQKAEDMTTPETFIVSPKRPLTTGRRPDRTGVRAKAAFRLRAQKKLATNFVAPGSSSSQRSTIKCPPAAKAVNTVDAHERREIRIRKSMPCQ